MRETEHIIRLELSPDKRPRGLTVPEEEPIVLNGDEVQCVPREDVLDLVARPEHHGWVLEFRQPQCITLGYRRLSVPGYTFHRIASYSFQSNFLPVFREGHVDLIALLCAGHIAAVAERDVARRVLQAALAGDKKLREEMAVRYGAWWRFHHGELASYGAQRHLLCGAAFLLAEAWPWYVQENRQQPASLTGPLLPTKDLEGDRGGFYEARALLDRTLAAARAEMSCVPKTMPKWWWEMMNAAMRVLEDEAHRLNKIKAAKAVHAKLKEAVRGE